MDSNPKNQTERTSSVNVSSTEAEKAVCGDIFKIASPTGTNNDNSPNNNGDNTVINAEHCVSGNQISQTEQSSEEYMDLNKCGKLSVEMGFQFPRRTRFRIFENGSMFASFYGDDGLLKTIRVTAKNSSKFPQEQINKVLDSSKRDGVSVVF